MAEEIGGAIGAIGTLYLMFDFFLWSGGLLDPSIIARINSIGMILGV